MQKIYVIILLLSILYPSSSSAKVDEPEEVGNFLLPTSQQPGPCFGFGQNILDKGDKQFIANFNQLGGKRSNTTLLVPGLVYGFEDYFSLYAALPLFIDSRDGCNWSRGVGDSLLQLEYVYINKQTKKDAIQATIIGTLFLPTGSGRKNPNTGFGAPSFFFGTTFCYEAQWWAAWIQGGALLTGSHHGTKFGNAFLYQAGLEWCFYAQSGVILAWLLEGFGLYSAQDILHGKKNNNSGSNSIWLGPSFWASNKKVFAQLGFAGPVLQQFCGLQNRSNYYISINVGYKF